MERDYAEIDSELSSINEKLESNGRYQQVRLIFTIF